VAVIAIFREVGAPRRLTTLVENESLLNDAAAIVLFSSLLTIAIGQSAPTFSEMAFDIVREFAGGAAFGALAGRLAASVIGRIDRGGPAETTLSVALAYLAYATSDLFLHVSGVVAVVAAGLVFGSISRGRISGRAWGNVTAIWSQLGFWASSLIFVLASTLTPRNLGAAAAFDLVLLVALLAGAFLARAISLWGIVPLLTRGRRISNAYKLVILWGGLRGAVTLALVLAVTESETAYVPEDIRHLVSVVATGFVLFTLLVQGMTLRPLIHWLRLDQLDPMERRLRDKAMALAEGQILKRLSETAITYGIDVERAEEVQALYQRRLEASSGSDGEDLLRQQLLAALATITQREAQLYVEEQARGMVSRGPATILVRYAGRLLDALKAGGFDGYRIEARAQSRIGRMTRWAALLHRFTGLEQLLASRLAMRAELLLVRQHALQEAIDFTRTRIRALFGDRVAETAENVLQMRANELERSIDALRLQYPDYWEAVSGRYLSRVAVRLELEFYSRMEEERLLPPELIQHMTRELENRLQAFEAIPKLDLRLNVTDLISSVPLFKDLSPGEAEELGKLLVPRLALPGERIVHEGDRGDEMYFIASGAVEVYLPGERVRLGTGDFFGEIALLTRRPRQADVVAIAYTRLLLLRRESFRTFLRTHPNLMHDIRQVATRRLRSREANQQAEADHVSRETA
jgi:CPA1 family monovalent cation:H+ antiporter